MGGLEGLELKLCDDSIVQCTTFQGPEEVGVLMLGCLDLCTVSEDNIVANYDVHREAVFVEKVMDPTEQSQSGNTNRLESAAIRVQAIRCQSFIHIFPFGATADLDSVFLGIHLNFVQAGKDNENAVINTV